MEENTDSRGARLKRKALAFIKKNTVMVIALIAAAITCFFVPFDAEYKNYFDFKTLTCLFCVLAVVCALKNIKFFYLLAQRTVRLFKTARSAVLALVYITFIGSMLIANDMALLTFLPLGYLVLSSTGKRKYMAFTFVMQNIAANLGGMLTPFGNPQNLYLFSKFDIPTGEFVGIMAPPFIVSVLLITAFCLLSVKPEPLSVAEEKIKLPPFKTVVYLMLFALSIIIVFRAVPFYVGLIAIPVVLLILDRKALLSVDYPLLFTFVFFFIFAGNMGRIEGVRNMFSALLGYNTLIVSAMSCQIISNVPSAILLSQFTTDYAQLLVGVNIGGVGTLISSLASLITFREYLKAVSAAPRADGKLDKSRARLHNGCAAHYLAVFSYYNFGFLIVLTGFSYLTFYL